MNLSRMEYEIYLSVWNQVRGVEPDTEDILDIDIADAVKYGDDMQEQINSLNKS